MRLRLTFWWLWWHHLRRISWWARTRWWSAVRISFVSSSAAACRITQMGAASAGKGKGCDCTAIEGQQHCPVDDAIGFWMHCDCCYCCCCSGVVRRIFQRIILLWSCVIGCWCWTQIYKRSVSVSCGLKYSTVFIWYLLVSYRLAPLQI